MTTRAFRRRLITIAVASCFASAADANPVGPSVVSGAASFSAVGKNLTVTNAPGTIINWQGFSIRADEVARFVQSGAASAVLNRVTGPEHSALLGQLLSNGRVFLINPNGVTVGAGALIDTAGFVASSLNMSNEDFLAGKFRFTDPGNAGKVVNAGTINAHSGGPVYLIAPTVENHGVITAPGGEVMLAAGKSVELVSAASPHLRVQVQADGEALNLGKLVAESGRVGIYGAAVRNSGLVSADGVQTTAAGTVVLKASRDVTLDAASTVTASGSQGGAVIVQAEAGTLLADGRIDAKGAQASGGEVKLLGTQVGLVGAASVDASGAQGGGIVLAGGDYQGRNPEVQNAQATFVGSGATIRADAVQAGDGGKVVVWSDDTTRYHGAISARGGALGGNGGLVEVSGKETLAFRGGVDTSAPTGQAGSLLLDPTNINIVAGNAYTGSPASLQAWAPSNPAGTGNNVWAAAEDPGNQSIGAADIQTLLGTTSLTLQATNNITVGAAIGYAGAPARALTLTANGSLNVNAAIASTGGALTTNLTGGAGGVVFGPAGSVTTNGGAATIASTGITTLGSVTTGAGALSVTGVGAVTQNAGTSLAIGGTSSFSAGAGSITLTNPANNFVGAVSLANTGANNVAVTDANAIVLGASSVGSGTLAVTASGANAITQTGAIVQAAGAGAASFTTGAGAITLNTATNNFIGPVSLTNSGANNVSLRDTNALALGTVNVGSGTLSIQSNGALTQTGAITQAAGAGAVTVNAGAGAITLANVGNDFVGAVSLANTGANNVSLRDANALALGTVTVGTGTLALQSSGALTQTGAITQAAAAGAVTVNAGAGAITLTNAANNFIGAVGLNNSGANNVAVTDANAIILGTSNVGTGTLAVTATGASSITQTGAIVQAAAAGAASFTTGGAAITLANAGNDFTGPVSLTNSGANNVSLRDTNALALGTVNVGSGTLAIQSNGALTQTGAITQAAAAGAVTVNAGAGAITLTNAANNFIGAVSLTNSGANNVAVTDANAIVLGASTVGTGTLAVNATGANTITQTGAIVQAAGAGAASFTTGAGAITLNTATNNFIGPVSLANSGANNVSLRDTNALALGTVNVGSGTLAIQSNGALTQTGAITQAAGAGAVTINAGAGAITLNNVANDFVGAVALTNSGLNNVAVTDANAIVLGASSVGSGTLAVTASGANAITQTGAIVQAAGAGAASFTTGAGAITLNTATNNFIGPVSLTNSGANNVSLRDTNALALGTVNVGSGTLSIQSNGALTQTGAITQAAGAGAVTVNAGAGAITLANVGNDFVGAVSLANTGANNVSLRDANALALGTVTVGTGTLALQSSGALTQTGAITQAAAAGAVTVNAGAGAITLTNAANNFIGAVGLNNSGANNVAVTDANAIILGTSNVGTGTLAVTATGANAITQTGAIVQAAGAGAASFTTGGAAITLANAGNDFTGPVSLTNSGANNVSLRDTNALALGTVNVGSGTLAIQSNGALTQTGAITQAAAAGAVTVNAGAGAITLTNAANNFIGAVSLTNSGANNVAVTDANAIVLGASTVGTGTLAVNATGANTITQTGAIVQAAGAGAASFTTGAGAITLNTATNNFIGPVSLANSGANNVSLRDTNALALGTVNVGSGTLAIQSNGALTQTGAITQAAGAGAVTINAGAGAITLNNVANDFVGAVSLANTGANAVSLRDANALALGTVTVGTGTLALQSNGALTQTGALTQAAGAGAVTVNAGAGAITLTNPANNFVGAVSLNNTGANNVAVTDANAIILGTSNVGTGTLTVNATGANAITQTGAIVQAAAAGAASFTTGGAAITLANAGNDFTGPVSLTNTGANAVSVRDANALTLAGGAFGGTLTAQSNGALGQIGALSVTGLSSFNAGAGSITLTNAANNFIGAVSLANTGANNVAVTDANAIVLGASSVGTGTLAVNATGANTITQTGAIVQAAGAGAASFTTGAGVITLNTATNNFTGPVSLTNTGLNNVSITDTNALALGTVNVGSGTLAVTAGGAITQTGAITAAGPSTYTVTAPGSDILLASAANALTGAVTVTNNGNVRDLALRNTLASATLPTLPTGMRNLTLQFDNAAIALPATTLTGSLGLNVGGPLTQTGPLNVAAGTTSLAAGANNITLNDPANNFGTVSVASANAVSIVDVNALSVGPVNATGNVAIRTATGIGNDLTLTGNIASTGGDITLASGGDVHYGANTLSAGGRWLVYSQNWANDTGTIPTPGNAKPNLYNCTFGGPCGVTIPPTGNHRIYRDQPTLSYAADPASRLYGDPNPAFTGTVSGLVNGDTAADAYTGTLAFASPAIGTSNVGSYPINGSGLTSDIGYAFAQAPANAAALTINASTLTYLADPQSRIYGDPNPALTGTVTGFKNGESIPTATTGALAFATPAVPASNVGTYAINGSGLTANNGNYAFVQAGTNGTALIVTQRPITLTAGSAAREYGDPNPAVAVTANPTAPGTGVAPHETLAAAFPSLGAASGAIGTTPVGNYTAGPNAYSVTGATNANYLVTPVQGALAITPATLTYVANAAAREYGDPNPVLSGAVTGFKNGETIGTATTGALAFTTPAIGTTPVGAYAIDGGGLAAANYAFVQAPGNATALTISPRLITLTAGSAARAYGDANPVPAPLYTVGGGGMANAENAQTLFGFSVTSGAVANTAVGTYSTGANAYNVAGVVVGVNGNYNITAITPGTLTIGQRAIQVTADPNQTKIYGEPNPAAYTYALTSGSLVGTDNFSGATTRVVGENVGAYPIQQGTLTAGPNYALTFVPDNFGITVRPVTIAATPGQNKVYGSVDPVFGYAVAGGTGTTGPAIVAGDMLVGALGRALGENVAAYALNQGTLTTTAPANYTITFVPANVAITPAALSVIANAQTKVYGTPDPALTYNATGFQFADTPATVLSGALARAPGETVPGSPYAIAQGTLAPNANYTITYTGANLAITPAALSIAADNKTRSYGDPNPTLTATFTGLANGDSPAAIPGVALTTPATSASNTGNFVINVASGANPNYIISSVNGQLVITPAPLGLVADDKARAFGAPNPPFTATATGFKLGQTVNDLSGALVFATPATSTSPPGAYVIAPSGVGSTNYTITFVDGLLLVGQGAPSSDQALVTATARSALGVLGESTPGATTNVDTCRLAAAEAAGPLAAVQRALDRAAGVRPLTVPLCDTPSQ